MTALAYRLASDDIGAPGVPSAKIYDFYQEKWTIEAIAAVNLQDQLRIENKQRPLSKLARDNFIRQHMDTSYVIYIRKNKINSSPALQEQEPQILETAHHARLQSDQGPFSHRQP